MTSIPGQPVPDDSPVIVINGVPRTAAELKAMAREQAIMISDLLKARNARVIDDYWLADDGTAFIDYDDLAGGILWEISIRTVRAARLAETQQHSNDDAQAIELAQAGNKISRLREDLVLRNRDFDDCVAVDAQLQSELDGCRRDLAAAQARVAELEATGTGNFARKQ
jgi:hypothetical protein